jgi:hypothetical protein
MLYLHQREITSYHSVQGKVLLGELLSGCLSVLPLRIHLQWTSAAFCGKVAGEGTPLLRIAHSSDGLTRARFICQVSGHSVRGPQGLCVSDNPRVASIRDATVKAMI